MALITEGNIKIEADTPDIVSKEMPIFYNPVMKLNRDATIAYLKTLESPRVSDPLAGTGIRTLRILAEVPAIEHIHANDRNLQFKEHLEKELQRNNLSSEKLIVTQEDASVSLLTHPTADYIDIDPFGSPNPFLDAAIKRVRSGGVLAVTATDTAALCGTSVKACKRKYFATPLRTYVMKEIAVRMLIRKVQLIGAQYELCFEPILSFAHDHYMRIFLRRAKGGSERVDTLLKQHRELFWKDGFLADKGTAHGPLWTGPLQDVTVIDAMLATQPSKETVQLLETLKGEAGFAPGFYDVHAVCKHLKLQVPQFSEIEKELAGHGFARTIFSKTGIKTRMDSATFTQVLKKLAKRASDVNHFD